MADAPQPVLYTQTSCAESARVRSWLAERGIDYIERNVSRDPDAAQALYAIGAFVTPLLVVGQEKVVGFQPRALAALLQNWDEPRRSAATSR